jgi:tRNA-dihydrouridine synthase B
MSFNFWERLFARDKPIIGMSPMDGVTDAPFRYMVAKYGKPDIIFTEFVSTDGLHYAQGEKRERMLKEFVRARDLGEVGSSVYEVAQVFGNRPEFFVEAARLIESLGFDGMDINMGCPAKSVSEHGCGAGLIRTPKLAQEIIRAAQGATHLPVSVKTRIGVSDGSEMEEWISALMEVAPVNISLHGRTLKQLYQGHADWERIGEAAKIVHKHGGHILGNGDIESVESGLSKIKEYGVDGVLIGRAAEGNPAIFSDQYTVISDHGAQCDLQIASNKLRTQRLAWAIEHAQVYERLFKPKNTREDDARWFLPMRKHLAWYAHGFAGAVELRMALMKTTGAEDVERVIMQHSS